MLEMLGYRAAFYLSALIALMNCSMFIYARLFMLLRSDGFAVHAVGSLLVLVGLWLQSRIARYFGAAYYCLLAGASVYALAGLSKPVVNVVVVWSAVAVVTGAAAVSTLLLSRPFAREFVAEREKRPAYKKLLLNVYTVFIVVASVAMALADVVHIMSI